MSLVAPTENNGTDTVPAASPYPKEIAKRLAADFAETAIERDRQGDTALRERNLDPQTRSVGGNHSHDELGLQRIPSRDDQVVGICRAGAKTFPPIDQIPVTCPDNLGVPIKRIERVTPKPAMANGFLEVKIALLIAAEKIDGG